MRVLLTGSSGWLGRHLAPMLREAGHVVVGLDCASGKETQVVGTVADRRLVDETFAEHGIEAVIHAAALHKPDLVRYPAQAFVDVNMTGTLHLLEAATAAGHTRFVFTSTTSLMISTAIRAEEGHAAVWLTEESAPRAAQHVRGLEARGRAPVSPSAPGEGLSVVVLRTSRFFPEDDDTAHAIRLGPELKANELLYRRLTVEDAARAHVVALEKAPPLGFETLIVSAPTPFAPEDAVDLKRDAAAVVARYHPSAPELYARVGWQLPRSIGRVYDASRMERVLGFRCATDFASVLKSLERGEASRSHTTPPTSSPKEPTASASPRDPGR